MTKFLLPIALLLIVSCSQKTIESKAKSDSQKKLTRILKKRPVKTGSSLASKVDMNKIKELISSQCVKSTEVRYLGIFKGFDDSKNRMIFIEYVSCNNTWTLWSYKIQENQPELEGVWVDKFENRQKNMSRFLVSESWE